MFELCIGLAIEVYLKGGVPKESAQIAVYTNLGIYGRPVPRLREHAKNRFYSARYYAALDACTLRMS
jgi:hypothetical protein